MLKDMISGLEVRTSHEHIGSLTSFGFRQDPLFPSDVVPSLKPQRTGLVELLFSPYLASLIFDSGCGYPSPESLQGPKKAKTLADIMQALLSVQGTGVYEALASALMDLYGFDAEQDSCNYDALLRLDDAISQNYSSYFDWYDQVMQRSGTKNIQKPVHPEYLVRISEGEGADELRYATPILRIDSLAGFPDKEKILDFGGITEKSGIDIIDAETLDQAIAWFFELADRTKCKAVKQLQAYYRHIDIAECTRAEVDSALIGMCISRSGKTEFPNEKRLLIQDYILRRILEETDKRSLPYQIHTGMTTLKNSNPALLEPLFRQYPGIRFVLLHTYPFVSEASYLARTNRNVYLDTSWQVLQSPAILEKCLTEWIGMVPYRKITSSIDATSLEEYYGGLKMTRTILARVLEKKVTSGEFTESAAGCIAKHILSDNQKMIYG